ncbi:hypothetical protein [Streptomyces rubiginosohelvolus]|uniref:Integrase n=1 Tax=Streptomyces rubiginosohelvolus TaxID=67362 RepID=A0ABQ3C0G7_9ACTN|nr:hypothetical protein [Streptomyces pluricolorescens]GGZ63762.1 hypothetical protein GCM10010328_42950 [Streptomyces pluricolorescens]
MPAIVIDDPLSVRCWFNNGTEWTFPLSGLPNEQLARDLALGMAANSHPHGGIGARRTATGYAVSVRQTVKKLAREGFTGSASDLSRPLVMRYFLASSHEREREVRMILKGFDRETGRLAPEVRAYLKGKQVQQKHRSRPYRAYSDGEWERLESSLRQVVDESWLEHKRLLRLAETGRDPRVSGHHNEEDIAWLLLREGPMRFYSEYVKYVAGYVTNRRSGGSNKMVMRVREGLYPGQAVQHAYAVLFGVYSGIVPDGIDDLGLDGVDWAGDAAVLLTYVKGRTARESLSIPSGAVRLLERWLEHSAPLRRFANNALRDKLWIAQSVTSKYRISGPPTTGKTQRQLIANCSLLGDNGQPLVVHRGRIRATYEERLARRDWTGRATIDPNHTPRTEGDHYVTPSDPAALDAVESIIEDGQSLVLRKATPAIVLSSERAAEFAEGFPDEVNRLGLDTEAIAELVGGERDVFTAACANQLAGLHGPKGKPCPARPWVCLLCPLAVFLPRHSANLLRLDAFFLRQFRQMPTEHYLRVFGPYAHRLSEEILPKFSAEAKEKGALEVADDDAELPLRPEEVTA